MPPMHLGRAHPAAQSCPVVMATPVHAYTAPQLRPPWPPAPFVPVQAAPPGPAPPAPRVRAAGGLGAIMQHCGSGAKAAATTRQSPPQQHSHQECEVASLMVSLSCAAAPAPAPAPASLSTIAVAPPPLVPAASNNSPKPKPAALDKLKAHVLPVGGPTAGEASRTIAAQSAGVGKGTAVAPHRFVAPIHKRKCHPAKRLDGLLKSMALAPPPSA